jgi:hypothetical protein
MVQTQEAPGRLSRIFRCPGPGSPLGAGGMFWVLGYARVAGCWVYWGYALGVLGVLGYALGALGVLGGAGGMLWVCWVRGVLGGSAGELPGRV